MLVQLNSLLDLTGEVWDCTGDLREVHCSQPDLPKRVLLKGLVFNSLGADKGGQDIVDQHKQKSWS